MLISVPADLLRRGRIAVALVTAAMALLAAGEVAASPAADRVLRNGHVYTVDDRNSVASALAIRDGRIVYVGSDRGARRFVGRRTEVTNLKGRMVMPGLQDGHIHDIVAPDPFCDLEYAPLTLADLQTRLRECLGDSRLGSGSDWLRADNFYIQFMLPAGAGSRLTKADLDAVSTERPIFVRSSDAHTTIVNSRALEAAGVTAATPNPADGVVEKDAFGQPTGVLQDGARRLILDNVPALPPGDPLDSARRQMAVLNQDGITTVFNPGNINVDQVDDILAGKTSTMIETYRKLQDRGQLTLRAHFAIRASGNAFKSPGQVVRAIARYRRKVERRARLSRELTAWRPGVRARRSPRLVARPGVSIDGAKFLLDGVVQYPAQTAAMLKPYLTNAGTPDNPQWVERTGPGARGQLYIDNPLMGRLVARLERAGMQSHIHAIGDRSVRVALDAVQQARRRVRRSDSRPSIAHAEVVDPADLPRFRRLAVIPVMSYQWAKPAPDSTDTVKPYLGPERWDRYEPEGALRRAGTRIAFGSDHAVDPLDSFFDLEVAVLREADWGPEFPQYLGKLNADPGLSLAQAIRGMTINAAYQMHQDKTTGSLERGKLADLIVLNQNLFRVPRDDISNTDPVMTMVGGRIVYRGRGF